MELYNAMKNRRTRYDITDKSPISEEKIINIVSDAITYTPSAFHSQSSRVVVLFGEKHQKLWSIVMEELRSRVPADKFSSTETKIQSFANGYGTILYYEDMDTVSELQKNFPSYADNFPLWSNQSAGMLQYAIWTALSQEGLGASLQHYNPIIDAEVAKTFNISENWKLMAQMPYGSTYGEVTELTYKPIEDRLRIYGSAK